MNKLYGLFSDVKKFLDDRFQLITEQSLEHGRKQMNHDLECSKEYMELMQSIFEKVYHALENLTRSYVKDLKENGIYFPLFFCILKHDQLFLINC